MPRKGEPLPEHLVPGNPGNSGGKPGLSGRRSNGFKALARFIMEHPRLQRHVMREALAEGGNVPLWRFLHEAYAGKATQVIVHEGEVDLLVQNAYPGTGALPGTGLKNVVGPELRRLAAADGVEVEEDLEDLGHGYATQGEPKRLAGADQQRVQDGRSPGERPRPGSGRAVGRPRDQSDEG